MHLITFESKRTVGSQVGIVLGERVVPLSLLGNFPDTMLELIKLGSKELRRVRKALREQRDLVSSLPLADTTLLAPIPRPTKNVICLGWNYSAHADESGRATGQKVELPEHPVVFTKAPTAVNKPYGDVVYNRRLTRQLDWEVELGVIIGRPGKTIPVKSALNYVFGYTVINDISARDLQQRHRQFFLGKSLDGACPMGPWIVTADEIPDPQGLTLRSYVNDALKQNGTTADQIFTVAQTISILSQGMTLEAGDIIATGTPDGVGSARTPPEFLEPDDVVVCEISGIGLIRNRIVAI